MANVVIELAGQRHVQWQCKTCGVIATCPEVVWNEQLAEGGYHYCPNGHQWGWSNETCERERLRRERDRLQQQVAQRDDVIAAKEREIKRIKKRSAAGTCPCCKRTFSNMSTHMKRQHPDYVSSTGAKVVPFKVEA